MTQIKSKKFFSGKDRLIFFLIIATFAILLSFLIKKAYELPKARKFSIPDRTKWKPKGRPLVGNYSYDIIPTPITFNTMHVTVANSDQVWIAAAPVFEYAWSVEPDLYIAEGPTLDNEGNLYFSPFSPKENISLVSLDAITGERRWIIEDPIEGGGAPLILNDPDNKGKQIIYYSHYEMATAIETSGKIIWRSETGLKRPKNRKMHIWGCNYHAPTDSIVILSIDAELIAMDRKTGKLRTKKHFTLPGSPSKNSLNQKPNKFFVERGNEETDRIFGRTKMNNNSVNEAILNAVLADGSKVSNYFCIDPNTGAIYVAATAEDELDGKKDSFSEDGAIYKILIENNGEYLTMKIVASYRFPGGSGATPTMNHDSTRLYASDDMNKVIALDSDLNFLWEVDLGSKVLASIAASQDNNELYAATEFDIFKIIDHGTHGEIVWKANLDAYPGWTSVNSCTITITANGIVVFISVIRDIPFLPISKRLRYFYGMALLDRETGNIRYFDQGIEETISLSVIGPDGSYYQGLSPVVHNMVKGTLVYLGDFLGDIIPHVRGGITRYRPIRYDILARDIYCGALDRITNLINYTLNNDEISLKSAREDYRWIESLLNQGQLTINQLENSMKTKLQNLHDNAFKFLSLKSSQDLESSLENLCYILDK